MAESEHWSVSRQFNLSFLLGVFVQTVMLVWYISGLDSTVQSNGKELIRHETRIQGLEETVQDQAVKLARIDENIAAIRQMMERDRP